MPAQAIIMAVGSAWSPFVYAFAMVLAGAVDAYILGSILAPDSTTDLGRQNLVIRSASEPHKIVYGRTAVGGTVVFLDVLDRYYLAPRVLASISLEENRERKKYLNMAVAIAAHEIDGIEEIYVGEDLVFQERASDSSIQLVDNKYKDNIEFIGYTGNQTIADNFIKANVDKHYLGKYAPSSTNLEYYRPLGVTGVTTNSITIDHTQAWSTNNYLNYSGRYRDGDNMVISSGIYDGTYPLYFDSTGGHPEPVNGRPWTASHKLINTAYIYLRFKYNPDLYKSGVPKVRAVIRGKKVYDPRYDINYLGTTNDRGTWQAESSPGVPTVYAVNDIITHPVNFEDRYVCIGAHTAGADWETAFVQDFILDKNWKQLQQRQLASTWEYSDNWALCLRDYLVSGNYYERQASASPAAKLGNSLYGIGINQAELDDTNIIEAANIADEIVWLRDTGLLVETSTYDADTGIQTVTVLGDHTDYYTKYESVSLNGTLGQYINAGLIAIRYSVAPDYNQAFAGISSFDAYITSSSYNATSDITTVKFRVDQDYPLTGLIRVYSRRFTVNGIVDTSATPISVLEDLLAAGAGKLSYTQGKYKVIPGVYINPALDNYVIDESYLAGPVSVSSSLGTGNIINTVVGTIKNPANDWEESNFPKQTHSNYIIEDGGYELVQQIKLPFTTSNFDAQRLARISLQRARLPVSASLSCNSKALNIPVGAFIKVNIDRLGWVDEIFSVTSWNYKDGKINLGIRQEESTAYDWINTDLIPIVYRPTTSFNNLPVLDDITGLTLSSGTETLYQTADGTIVPRVLVEWVDPGAVDSISLELVVYIIDTTAVTKVKTFIVRDPSSGTYYIDNIAEGNKILVEATLIFDDPNNLVRGNTVASTQHVVVGKSQPPANVTGLVNNIKEDMLVLSWNPNTEIDFSHYLIKEGISWAAGTVIDNTVSKEYIITGIGSGPRTYWVASVDSSNIESVIPASTSITVSAPSTPGLITNTVLTSGAFNISWPISTIGTFSLSHYQVLYDGGIDWNNSVDVKGTEYIIPEVWVGSRTIQVRAVDVYGNVSTASTLVVTGEVPNAPQFPLYSVAGPSIVLGWTASTVTTFPISHYEIDYSGNETFINSVNIKGTEYTIPEVWLGARTLAVRAVDVNGNVSLASSLIVTINAPTIIGAIADTVQDTAIVISWYALVPTTFPISHYQVLYDGGVDWATAINVNGTNFTIPEVWLGNRTVQVRAVDINSNIGAEASKLVTIDSPGTVSLITDSVQDTTVVISWPTVPPNTFAVSHYEVLYDGGVDWATAVNIKGTSFTIPEGWVGSRTVQVRAVDINGNIGVASSSNITVADPSIPGNITDFVQDASIGIFWVASTPNTFAVSHYEVLYDGGVDWATAVEVKSTTFIIPEVWLGSRTIQVRAVDVYGNVGSPRSTVVTTTASGSAGTITTTILDTSIGISWGNSIPGTFAVSYYQVLYNGTTNWATAVDVKSTNYVIPEVWVGDRIVRVRAVDVNGNFGTEIFETINISAPDPININTPTFAAERVEFTWNYAVANTGTFPVSAYEVRHSGTDWASATPIITTSTDGFSRAVDWGGLRTYRVKAIDTVGNFSNETTVDINIVSPGSQGGNLVNIIPQVVDNNVLLRWNDVSETLPIAYYEVRKGDVYASASIIGQISSLFTAIFETLGGVYTYWVTPVDTAGNIGTSISKAVNVSEPPDYILLANEVDDFTTVAATEPRFENRVLTNAIVNSAGKLNMPVNTSETWATHFTGNAWTTIQDQINAGFPRYIQPTPGTATYQFTYDYGAVIANTSVTITPTWSIIAGDPTMSFVMESSNDNNQTPTNWTTYSTDSYKVFIPTFRHVRCTFTVSSAVSDTDLIEMDSIAVVLDVKEKADAGTGTVTATGGTAVTFNKPFIDISSIVVTAKGTTNTIAIYDFLDAPNPTGFTVYLFNGVTGAEVGTGDFSWNVRGY